MLCQRICKNIQRESKPQTILMFFKKNQCQGITELDKLSRTYASIEIPNNKNLYFLLEFENISNELINPLNLTMGEC